MLGLLVKAGAGLAKRALPKLFNKRVAKAVIKRGVEVARDTAIGTVGYKLGQRSKQFTPGRSERLGSSTMSTGATCDIKGFHLNRSGYHTNEGYVAPRSKCVPNRRMNPLNGHAARRAISRIKGARKMLQRIERSLPKRAAKSSTRGRK